MALQGTLDTFALPDVLHLLAATKKTGCLRLTGTRGSGTVAVDGGSVVAVTADHAPRAVEPTAALFELLRFEDGTFAFDPEATVDGAGAGEDVDALLDGAGVLLAEWREIESVVPSLASRVRLRAELESKSVTISRDQWPTLVAVGEGTTVGGLGDRLGLAELPISRVVRDLVELGVVDIEPVDELPAEEPAVDVADEPEPEPVLEEPAHEPVAAEQAPVVDEVGEDEVVTGAHFADPGAEDAEDELPTAPPIRARRPRPRTYELHGADDERFVPLDLPGAAPAGYDEAPALEADLLDDDLAAAFPGLAGQNPRPADQEDVERQLDTLSPRAADAVRLATGLEESEPATDEGDEGDEDGAINRGLLLKFLGSVKS